jgi:hypothetical protein
VFYGVCRQATNFILQNTIFLFITTKFNLLKNLFRGHFYIVSILATKVLTLKTKVGEVVTMVFNRLKNIIFPSTMIINTEKLNILI